MATMLFLSGDEDAISADKELNECIAIDADLQIYRLWKRRWMMKL